jgi:hypothetical protein
LDDSDSDAEFKPAAGGCEEIAGDTDDDDELDTKPAALIPQDSTVVCAYKLYRENSLAADDRLFPVSSLWASKRDLKEVITKYGLTFGIKVVESGWAFPCNKAGFTRDRPDKQNPDLPEEKKQTGNRSWKVGC